MNIYLLHSSILDTIDLYYMDKNTFSKYLLSYFTEESHTGLEQHEGV